MKRILLLLPVFFLCEARPKVLTDLPTPSYGGDEVNCNVVGGNPAEPGEYPHQLTQERQSGTIWVHTCGASLLRVNAGLIAAHCVDGASANILRIRAGVHDRLNSPAAQTVQTARYIMHEQYNNGAATYANDIAIMHFVTSVTLSDGVALANLPLDNNYDFSNLTCTITGWGKTSSSCTYPTNLQHALVGILTNDECVTQGSPANIWSNQICAKDTRSTAGACGGDSGGPLNCPKDNGASITVVGIGSFYFSGEGQCLQTYPSVYTRISAYLAWIDSNAP